MGVALLFHNKVVQNNMSYSKKVIDHYENPQNVGSLDKSDPAVGTGLVGAPACGDVMKLQLKINDDAIIPDRIRIRTNEEMASIRPTPFLSTRIVDGVPCNEYISNVSAVNSFDL